MGFKDFGRRFSLTAFDLAPAQFSDSDVQLISAGLPRNVAESLAELSLTIVRETRGPVRLWDFARRLEQRLGMPRTPTGQLCDAIKAALEQVKDPRVAVMATSMPGVGYVYDAQDPDARPVRASR
jgi:hypothetical protein